VGRRRAATEFEVNMGERLQRLRQAKGLSQSQLARAAGVPAGTLKNWEQGRRTMLIDAAMKVADALECTLDELVGRTPPAARRGKK
jgi:XRE family transcriptional regulator, regulator of sulfur utilization